MWSCLLKLALLRMIVNTASKFGSIQAWAGLSFWLIPSCSNERNGIFFIYRYRSISSCSIKKCRSHSLNKKYRSMTGPDRWWKKSTVPSLLSHESHSISFISWNLNITHSKTKEQTHEIQLSSAKIHVLMRTNEILWYKQYKTVEQSWTVTTVHVRWE
jgi:hypothetical protein